MSELKKILIKAPLDNKDAVTTYPLIHQLKTEYPNSQIHIIVGEEQEQLYKVFPFETFTYVYNEQEQSLPAIHKFAVNLHDIFNIDLFFDLVGSFKSAFLGFSFKAKERISYVSGLNKVLLTHKVEPYSTYRPDKLPLHLLESFLENNYSSLKINGLEKKEQLMTKDLKELVNLPPYFMIHSDKILEEVDFWNDFFRFFEEQYFVIWFDPKLGEEEYEKLSKYFKGLEQKNVYLIKTGTEDVYQRLLVHSIGYITNNLDWAYVANYLDVNTYVLVNKATDLPFMEHFEKAPVLIELSEGIPVKWIGQNESQPVETVDRLVNIFHDIHEL